MIPVANGLVNEKEGIQTSLTFNASAKNLGVLFHIVRNQLYSDPILAVIREYSTNGFDAHIAAGIPEKPIKITLPTQLESFFKIRDFGKGLSEQEIQDIYVSYGESTKRQSQDQTGMLGIGCKSGFAYGDSFLINSYYDGKLTAWNAYLDGKNEAHMDKLCGPLDTTEPSGMEIIIPVKGGDVAKFREKAIYLFKFFKVLPDFETLEPDEIKKIDDFRNDKGYFRGPGWRYIGKNTQSYAVMGNIPYPINASVFTDEIREEIKTLIQTGLIVDFNIGELEFAASREALQYTTFTKKKLAGKLNDITNVLFKEVSQTFDRCKTFWEAKCLYNEVFDYHGSLHGINSLFKTQVTFKGFPLNSNTFSIGSQFKNSVVVYYYQKPNFGGEIVRSDITEIKADPKFLVVENDTAICNGIKNRVVGLLEPYDGKPAPYNRVYIVRFSDPRTKTLWMNETGFDGQVTSLKSLPKESLTKYYPNLKTPALTFNLKHVTKEFSYQYTGKYAALRSDFWKPEEVDLDKDTGVYVELERFDYRKHYIQSKFSSGFDHPRELNNVLAILKNVGIVTPAKIYGFKHDSVEKAEKNPNMTYFWKWLDKAIRDYITNNTVLEQEMVDAEYASKTVLVIHHSLYDLADVGLKFTKVDPNSPFVTFCKNLKTLSQTIQKDQYGHMKNAMELIGYNSTLSASVKMDVEYEKQSKAYPLLFLAAAVANSYRLTSKEWAKAMEDYVILVDSHNKTLTPNQV